MRLKEGFELRKVGQENVLVPTGSDNINFGKIISMNESAAWLWDEIGNQDFTPEILASKLVQKYAIGEDIAINDARFITNEWKNAGICE